MHFKHWKFDKHKSQLIFSVPQFLVNTWLINIWYFSIFPSYKYFVNNFFSLSSFSLKIWLGYLLYSSKSGSVINELYSREQFDIWYSFSVKFIWRNSFLVKVSFSFIMSLVLFDIKFILQLFKVYIFIWEKTSPKILLSIYVL